MNQPIISEALGSITYTWEDLGLRVQAERISDDGYAELRFFSSNGKDESLLHITRDVSIAKLLILKGADVNAKDFKGQTPLDNAREFDLVKLSDYLESAGGKSGKAVQ